MKTIERELDETGRKIRELSNQIPNRSWVQPRATGQSRLLAALATAVLVTLVIGLPALLLTNDRPSGAVSDPSTRSTTAPPETAGSEVTATTLAVETPLTDTSFLVPTPDDVEAILADAEPSGTPVAEWRPVLEAERIWCMYRDSPGANTGASHGPLGDPLTIDDILFECDGNNDPARNLESPPESFTICRGVFDPSTYAERFSSGGETLIAGNPGPDLPGFPVVLGWDSDCVSERLETNPAVRLSADISIEKINQVRSVEVALRGARLLNECPDASSRAVAQAVVDQLGGGWLLVQGTGGIGCGVGLDGQWGLVIYR
jgi:hypothetical protein